LPALSAIVKLATSRPFELAVPQYLRFAAGTPDADQDVIAKAYLRLREQHHPKNNPGDPVAGEIVRYLDSVYAVLVDSTCRLRRGACNGHQRPMS
jgi:hypothetical protein